MQRGFKTKAEREALQQRQVLGLGVNEPLLARRLIKHQGIPILTPHNVPGLSQEHLFQLLEVDNSGWSAVTIHVKGKAVIIHNPTHSLVRQETDLIHEVGHILCNHQPMYLTSQPDIPFILRSYDSDQEKEADWIAGCLKLPRDTLMWAVKKGMENIDIAAYFHASIQLVEYRRRITGIDRQLGYARGRF